MSAFQTIINIAGRDAAMRVAELKGGRQVYIPHRLRPGHWLAKAIGLSHAVKIANEYGGCRVEIPIASVERRHAAIVELFERGKSAAEVARELNINVRTARRHRPRVSAPRPGALNRGDRQTTRHRHDE